MNTRTNTKVTMPLIWSWIVSNVSKIYEIKTEHDLRREVRLQEKIEEQLVLEHEEDKADWLDKFNAARNDVDVINHLGGEKLHPAFIAELGKNIEYLKEHITDARVSDAARKVDELEKGYNAYFKKYGLKK